MKIRTSKSKHNNKKVEIDGIVFDSTVEGNYYLKLKSDIASGRIRDFSLQPEFELQPKFRKDGKARLPIKYRSDFLVTLNDGSEVIVDIKGNPTPDALMKRKMFDFQYACRTLKWIAYSKIDGGMD